MTLVRLTAAQANGLDAHKPNGQATSAISNAQAQALLQQVRSGDASPAAAGRAVFVIARRRDRRGTLIKQRFCRSETGGREYANLCGIYMRCIMRFLLTRGARPPRQRYSLQSVAFITDDQIR